MLTKKVKYFLSGINSPKYTQLNTLMANQPVKSTVSTLLRLRKIIRRGSHFLTQENSNQIP